MSGSYKPALLPNPTKSCIVSEIFLNGTSADALAGWILTEYFYSIRNGFSEWLANFLPRSAPRTGIQYTKDCLLPLPGIVFFSPKLASVVPLAGRVAFPDKSLPLAKPHQKLKMGKKYIVPQPESLLTKNDRPEPTIFSSRSPFCNRQLLTGLPL